MKENRLFTQSRHNHLLLSLLSFEKRKASANFMDVNLIRVAPQCHDVGGLDRLYHGTFGQNAYFQKR
jgi:hypothetical protein